MTKIKKIKKFGTFEHSHFEFVSDFVLRHSNLSVFLLIVIVCLIFFYPLFKGYIPFPGDLLVGNSGPYNSNSYGGFAPGAVPHKAQGPDVLRQLYPWKHFVIESIKNGELPFWNPYNFSGNPLLANFQSAAFYPFNGLFLLLPFNDAWTIFIFITPVLAAFFTYLYLREINISPVPSIFGGIVFAFSSYMVVWIEYGNIGHTLLWLPLGLYLTEKIIKNFDKRYWLAAIVIFTVSVLSGYIQGYFYSVVFWGFYFLFKQFKKKMITTPSTFFFLLFLVIPVFLTLFQFLPTLELFSFSSRGNYSLETIQQLLNPWWYAITVIVPDFFGHPASRNHWFYGTYIERVSYFGVIPLFFSLFALGYYKKRQEIAILAILFGISFVLAFDLLFTKFFYLIPIPVISTTVPTRILSLFSFSGALLSAIGFHYFLQNKEKRKVYIAYLPVLALQLTAWLTVFLGPKLFQGSEWIQHLAVSKRNLIIPTTLVASLIVLHFFYFSRKKSSKIFITVICILTFVDLFRFFHKITPFAPREYVYPQTPVISYIQKNAGINRYWGYGSGYVDTNFQLYDHTYIPDGNDALHIRNYTEFLESSKNGKLPAILPRHDANVAPGYGTSDLRDNYYRQKVLNILGVKYILHKNGMLTEDVTPDFSTFDSKIYTLIWQKPPWQIYENRDVTSRVFLTADYRVIPNKGKLLSTFYEPSFDEKKTLLLEKDPKIKKKQLTVNKAEIIAYEPSRMQLETTSDNDALLFLSDTYHPDWKATIDGKKAEVLVANYAFRAVKVPKGQHQVEFYYESSSYKRGLMLSGLLAVVLMVVYFIA